MKNLDDEFKASDAQLKALMQVINEITTKKVPFYEPHELAARSSLRALQWAIDDCNALDDSDLIDTLNQAKIEIKYLCAIITDLKKSLAARERDIQSLQDRNNDQWSEIQRLENELFRAK